MKLGVLKISRAGCFAVVLGAVCAMPAVATAQTWSPREGIDLLPSGSTVLEKQNILGWDFHPVVAHDEVKGFLAECPGGVAISLNVKMVYFEADTATSWKSYGWIESNDAGAVEWLKLRWGDSALSRSTKYACRSGPANAAVAVAPEEMIKGMFASDPNRTWVESLASPEAVVEFFADIGYQVAPILSKELSGADGTTFLNELGDYAYNQATYTLYPATAQYRAGLFADLFCSCKTVTLPPVVLQPPGVATPDAGTYANGYCTVTYTRCIEETTTFQAGRMGWDCAGCGNNPANAPTTTCTLTETTTVQFPGPCAPPLPAPEPGQPWWLVGNACP